MGSYPWSSLVYRFSRFSSPSVLWFSLFPWRPLSTRPLVLSPIYPSLVLLVLLQRGIAPFAYLPQIGFAWFPATTVRFICLPAYPPLYILLPIYTGVLWSLLLSPPPYIASSYLLYALPTTIVPSLPPATTSILPLPLRTAMAKFILLRIPVITLGIPALLAMASERLT